MGTLVPSIIRMWESFSPVPLRLPRITQSTAGSSTVLATEMMGWLSAAGACWNSKSRVHGSLAGSAARITPLPMLSMVDPSFAVPHFFGLEYLVYFLSFAFFEIRCSLAPESTSALMTGPSSSFHHGYDATRVFDNLILAPVFALTRRPLDFLCVRCFARREDLRSHLLSRSEPELESCNGELSDDDNGRECRLRTTQLGG